MGKDARPNLPQVVKDIEDLYKAASEEDREATWLRLKYLHMEGGFGRPSKYKPEFADKAGQLAKLGATDEEIAAYLDIAVPTFYEWKAKHDDFAKACKLNKAAADDRVEDSLFKQATSGNTAAAIFWLKNRRAQEWRDKREYTVQDHRSEDDIAKALMARVSQADKGKRPN